MVAVTVSKGEVAHRSNLAGRQERGPGSRETQGSQERSVHARGLRRRTWRIDYDRSLAMLQTDANADFHAIFDLAQVRVVELLFDV